MTAVRVRVRVPVRVQYYPLFKVRVGYTRFRRVTKIVMKRMTAALDSGG